MQRTPPAADFLPSPGPPSGASIAWERAEEIAGPEGPPQKSAIRARRRRSPLVAIAIAAVVALLVGAAALWSTDDDDERPLETASPTTTAPTTSATTATTEAPTTSTSVPPPDDELLAMITEAKEFVSTVRGREFRSDVEIRAFDADEWSEVILDQFGITAEALAIEAIGLVALGLLTPEEAATYPEDVIESYQRIPALYDAGADIILIRDGSRDATFRRTLVHEVTHAFDDQWFDLARGRDAFPVDSEAAATLELVVEGNAVRVETLWLASLDEAERSAAGPAPAGRGLLEQLDDVIEFDLRSRYLIGLTFTEHVAQVGGEELIDGQLESPPVTSEQVWFPAVFDRGETRVPVPAPPVPTGAEITDEGPVGVSWWYRMLAFSNADLTPADAERAVDGWGGDWRVSWNEDGLTCTRADVVGDTPGDTKELLDAVQRWAESTDGGVVASEVDGRVRIEYCVPNPGAGESRI